MRKPNIADKVHFCMSNDVKVYVEIYNTWYLKIVADVQGKKIYGEDKYNPNRRTDQKKIQQKCLEVYEKLYDNLMKKSDK